jgi:transposase
VVTLAIWAKLLPIEAVQTLFQVSWSTVYVAVEVEVAVRYGEARRTSSRVLHIGANEISRRKGHTYLTQVYDLDRRTLLWSGNDRKVSSLRVFFIGHPELTPSVIAVCCDM